MKAEQLKLVGNIIEFPKKKQVDNNDKFLRNKEIKDTVNMLLDNYEGDFCIVFKSEGIGDIFEEKLDSETLIASTNREETRKMLGLRKIRNHFLL